MLYSYNQCLEKYKSDYQIKVAIREGELFKQEKGIYSDEEHVPELAIIVEKYPDAVFTLHSAFYYHALTSVVPDYYYLATDRDAAKIRDKRVRQIFCQRELLYDGVVEIEWQGTPIKVYDRQRMLIELLRNRNKLDYDYYKDIVMEYRDLAKAKDMQLKRLLAYAKVFPKSSVIEDGLKKEIY
ncbi:MAG: hypothetical protein IJZ23_09625 [Roseburia sp.]|nr:hypothetical protein [Roseburia sp.]